MRSEDCRLSAMELDSEKPREEGPQKLHQPAMISKVAYSASLANLNEPTSKVVPAPRTRQRIHSLKFPSAELKEFLREVEVLTSLREAPRVVEEISGMRLGM